MQPLKGVKVLDLTLARAGPTCVRHLTDWGAEAVAVVAPSASDAGFAAREGSDFQNLHRGKRMIALDLKSPAGRAAFLRLAQEADVVIENMRPAVKHRLGVAYDDLKVVNPRLVYGSVSGFGQNGPYGDRAGVDQIAQGMGGMMSVTGMEDGPPLRAGIAVSDMAAGTLLALGVMMALFRRERTGEGGYVHTSLLESQLFMLDFQAARWLIDGQVAGRSGNDHPTIAPSSAYPTADGWVNIAVISQPHWRIFCQAMARPDWLDHPVWASARGRVQEREALNAAIAAITVTQTSRHWVDRLEAAGIPCGPVLTIDQAFSDPQVQHLGVSTQVVRPDGTPMAVVASPIHMTSADKRPRGAAPVRAGESETELRAAGFSDDAIDAMRRLGAI